MVNNAAAGRALGRGAPTERPERADGRLRRRAVFDEQAPIGGRAPTPNKKFPGFHLLWQSFPG